ncbi:MAG: ABC transporter substrate-binding protein [Candidatus Omnitrophica bacterium]|nr:ABC transporter substrate-binding protein [Candidatus Omnitrophota bacterium]
MKKLIWLVITLVLIGSATKASADPIRTKVRIGHFPNLTHAQALVGHANGLFEKNLGPVEWSVFNAGPSVIEALFAGQIDIAYIGPSPAVNGYVKSQGDALRVVAGAASGGAALVVRAGAGIETPADFHGKKIASPQLGNTQDVALRSWLKARGLELKETGGDVQAIPVANADQVTLFLKGEIDGAWTVEPWVSILEQTAGGKVFLDEASLWPGGKYATTVVIVRRKFLEEHPGIVKSFLKTHAEITSWINAHPEEAKKAVGKEIKKETHKPIPAEILESAWARIRFSPEMLKESVLAQAQAAFQAGFLKKEPELSTLFEPDLLGEDSPVESAP